MKVGIQLYSVKDMIARDPVAAFEKVAQIGYKCWEVCQLYGRTDIAYNYGLQMPPQEAKAFVASLGVTVVGSHLTYEQTQDEQCLEDYLSYMEEIGCKAAGLGSSYFPYMDMEALKAQCAHFNHVGERCRAHGMKFYYHNHYHEFQKFGDRTVYQLLMENTDPSLVWFELDTYWAMRAGMDPKQVLRENAGRILFIHQKDFPKNFRSPANLYTYAVDPHANLDRSVLRGVSEPDGFAEVGTGCMDIQGILDAANEAGVECVILEQDRTALTEEESITISMNAFKKYKGLEWA